MWSLTGPFPGKAPEPLPSFPPGGRAPARLSARPPAPSSSLRWRGRLSRMPPCPLKGALLLGQGYLGEPNLGGRCSWRSPASLPAPGCTAPAATWGWWNPALVALLSEGLQGLPQQGSYLVAHQSRPRMQPARIRPSVHLVGWRFPGRWLMDAPAQEPLSCPLSSLPSSLPNPCRSWGEAAAVPLPLLPSPDDLPCSSFHTTRRPARPGAGLQLAKVCLLWPLSLWIGCSNPDTCLLTVSNSL